MTTKNQQRYPEHDLVTEVMWDKMKEEMTRRSHTPPTESSSAEQESAEDPMGI